MKRYNINAKKSNNAKNKNSSFSNSNKNWSVKQVVPTEEEFDKTFITHIMEFFIILSFIIITTDFLLLNPLLDDYKAFALIIVGTPIMKLFKELKNTKFSKDNIIKKIKKYSIAKKLIWFLTISFSLSMLLYINPAAKAWAIETDIKIIDYFKDKISNETNANCTSHEDSPSINNDNINFIINDKNSYDSLNESYLSEVYLYSQQSKNALTYFEEIYRSESPISSVNNYIKIQENEDEFLKKVKEAKNYKQVNGTDEKWQELLPCENDLLKIIAQQENYAEEYPTFLVYQRLSNNYQRLALEYLQQNANESTIKYYYCQSLLCDYNSIKYAQDTQEYETALNRIYYRYQDIYTNCELSYDEANRLSSLMKQLDDYT